MIKCYHVRRIELVVDTDPQLFYQGPVITPLIATIDSDKEDLEDIWDCCNNSCWWDREDFRQMKDYKGQFNVEFTDDYSGYCNDDLIVEMGGKYHLAKSCGWKEFDSFKEAVEYSKSHSQWVQLHYKNKQHPEDREMSVDELNLIMDEYTNNGIRCRLIHK